VRARSRPSLAAEDIVRWRGIPVTTIVRTLIDLAGELSETAVERAVNEADKRDFVDPEALRDSLDRHGGEPGVKKLRTLLDRHTFQLSDSALESHFRKLAAAAGLPPPLTKHWLDGFEVDFYWPELDLVVETDGIRYHRTPAAQAHDRRRDQTHTAAGRTMLRFTHYQVAHERRRTATLLAKAARLARARQASAVSQGA
jgi:very-short-patch-repair endonuclease